MGSHCGSEAEEEQLADGNGRPLPEWAQGLRVYYVFLRNAAAPDRNPHGYGNFSDLRFVFEHAKSLGFNSVMVLSLCTGASSNFAKSDSPYSILSAYAIDPRYIDWKRLPLQGGMQDMEANTLTEILERFRPDLASILLELEACPFMADYARFRSLMVAMARGLDVTSIRGFDPGSSVFEREYRQEFEMALMQQHFAVQQLKGAVQAGHELGLRIGYDLPFFRTMQGVDAEFNPSIIMRDKEGQMEPAGWHVEDSFGQLWGNKHSQSGLAFYDWDELRMQNYEPILGPLDYFQRVFDFDFFRFDALHYGFEGYARAAGVKDLLCERIADMARTRDVLVVPETLGCQNEAWVNGICRALGFLPLDKPHDGWRCGEDRGARWRLLFEQVACRSSMPSFWTPSSHDSLRIVDEYGDLFRPGTPLDARARALYAFFGLLLPNYTLVFGDEYADDERIHIPGVKCTWRHPSRYGQHVLDIQESIREINRLRREHPFLDLFGNASGFEMTLSEGRETVSFTRSSPDGKALRVAIEITRGDFSCESCQETAATM